jgi:hypothetical protein
LKWPRQQVESIFCYSAARIGKRYYPFENFAMHTPASIIEKMNNPRLVKQSSIREAEEFIESLKENEISVSSSFFKTHSRALEGSRISYHFKKNLYFFKQAMYWGFLRKRFIRGMWRPNVFDSYGPKACWHLVVSSLNTLNYFRYAVPYEKLDLDVPYVYLTLHVMPEDSTLTLSYDSDEEHFVKEVAANLPADHFLYVKENPNMLKGIDRRRTGFYKTLSYIPNVRLISPEVPSLRLIKKSRAVASISGTSLLEGALFGKPSFRVGFPRIFCSRGCN